MEISAHWISYVHGAFALSNAFGPEWAYGKPYSRPVRDKAIEAATEALGQAMRTPPPLTFEDAVVLSSTGQELWQILHSATADLESSADLLNDLLERAKPQPRLTRHGPAGNWHLHFTASEAAEGLLWATDIAVATAILLGSEDINRVGTCHATRCDRVYLDQTRNQSQTYCSNRCQDRIRAANMRRRRQGLSAPDASYA